MAGVQLTGDIARLTAKLRRLSDLDLEGLNESLAEGVRTSTRLRFKAQQGPDGQPWKPSLRARLGKGKTLVQTARLRNSIRSRADEKGFAVGTNVIYAARHQFGDKRPVTIRAKKARCLRFHVGGHWISKKSVRVQLPARPFLGLGKEDLEEIRTRLEQEVSKEV